MWVFDDEAEDIRVKYSYWHTDEPLSWEEPGSYAAEDAKIKNQKSYEWQQTVGDVLNSLIRAGLNIREVNEHPFLTWGYIPKAKKVDHEYWRIEGDPLPMMWTVKAVKP